MSGDRPPKTRLFSLASLLLVAMVLLPGFLVRATSEGYIFVLAWGSNGSGLGQFQNPLDVAVDASGNVYVSDYNNNRIQKFDNDGGFLLTWGRLGKAEGEFRHPSGIAVATDSDGNVYVADTNNNRIQKFTPNGTFLLQWGNLGSGPGQFRGPHGVAVDGHNHVYVVDEGNNRVQKFDSVGRFITEWGTQGSLPGQFNQPTDITADPSGYIYVIDSNNNRVQKFDHHGSFVLTWGVGGTAAGQFQHPSGIAADAWGGIYVSDTLNNRIQKFDTSGNFLTEWGTGGSLAGQFQHPTGVAVDGAGNVFVADENNFRIQKFAPTSPPGGGSSDPAEIAGFLVEIPSLVTADQTVTLMVTALDANGHVLTGYTGTVTFGTTDPAAVLPQDYTFTASDSGQATFQAAFATVGSWTLTVSDQAAGVAGSAPVTVTASDSGNSGGGTGSSPGDIGPYDTKTLADEEEGLVLFTPRPGVTYRVFRHDKFGGRRFVPYGVPVRYSGDGAFITADPFENLPGESGWSFDGTYGYLVYHDPNVVNYEEYYYLVWADTDGLVDPNLDLNAYVVAAFFPPTQTRHGNYTEYTNACTACHGLHSSKFSKLLKGPSVTDLCGTCHDGTGSKYDEVRGYVRRGASWLARAFAVAGPFGDRLKEGSGVQVTSVHNVMRASDPGSGQYANVNMAANSARVWQAPGSCWNNDAIYDHPTRDYSYKFVSNKWSSNLVCSSCHEPHNRGKNYRLIRPVINDRTNIVVRGVSEVDLLVAADPGPDRGNWGNGDDLRRVMYTKFLTGGNSVMSYFDTRVEDPAWNPGDADTGDMDGDGDTAESRAQAYCDLSRGTLTSGDTTSPTGFRCRVTRALGGVTSFCTACHRTFVWPEAAIARNSYAYGYGEGVISGADTAAVSRSGSGPLGLTLGDPNHPDSTLTASLGRHKHPVSLAAARAYKEGRLVDGGLGSDGEICHAGKTLPDGTPDPRCQGVTQGRVVDPVLPLEGHAGDIALSPLPYQENAVMCLSCHVPHGSGSERIEVAYFQENHDGVTMDGDGINGTSGQQRDAYTGYLWNRSVDDATGLATGHPASPGDWVWDSGTNKWKYDRTRVDNPDYYTQLGASSALARFNPMASACFRCHSTTRPFN